MFEQEIEMEKKQSSVVPLLMIIGLIVSIVGVAFYYLLENRKVLTVQEATPIVLASLDAQGPATLHFRTGIIKASVDEKPHDPHYRLLEKAASSRLGKTLIGKLQFPSLPRENDFSLIFLVYRSLKTTRTRLRFTPFPLRNENSSQ